MLKNKGRIEVAAFSDNFARKSGGRNALLFCKPQFEERDVVVKNVSFLGFPNIVTLRIDISNATFHFNLC